MTNNRLVDLAHLALATTITFASFTNPEALCQTTTEDLPLKGTLPIPKVIEPAPNSLDISHGQRWHRVNLYLAGSMCPACLLELQGKLHRLPGVAYANIDYRRVATHTPDTNDNEKKDAARRKAATVIVYDQNAIHWKTLEHLIDDSKYHCSDVTDATIAEQVPPTQKQ